MFLNLPKTKAGSKEDSSPMARPPLERMSRLHVLLKSGEYPNHSKMAEELEVSRKTVQRDLDFMRDRLGLPIEYDARRYGFFYSGPVDSLPELDVSEGELVALLIAQKALHQHRGTVYEGPLLSACSKITQVLGERVSVNIDDLASRIFFKEQGFNEVPLEVFDAVGRAVRTERELAFLYKKLGAETEGQRQIRPYHLGCVNNQWYVFGFDLQRGDVRTFALTRLRAPQVLEVGFERPADFSIDAYLSDSMGVFRGGETIEEVRIRFDSWAAQIVRERVWHSSEKKTDLEGGVLELELRLSSLEEVERWVLSFGGKARVVHPPELVHRLRSAAEAMLKGYAEPGA